MNLQPTSFEDYIGHPRTLQSWKNAVTTIKEGQVLFIYGYSGVGKTSGTLLLTKEYNVLQLDTSTCNDSKEVLDRITKFHNWQALFDSNEKPKLIIIDELESFLKSDRNVLNHILLYLKEYGPDTIPIILIGDIECSKKLGEIKNYITDTVFINRLQDSDIFLYFKKRLPKNKIKLADLMKLVEDCRGNIMLTIQNITERLQKPKTYLSHYKGDEQKTFNEIFSCRNPDIVTKLLLEDTWMHPLKIHENSIAVLEENSYLEFLKKYLFFEQWQYTTEDLTIPIDYLAHIMIHHIPLNTKIETMEFSKLLSYISTQKKFKKMNYTFEDLGRNKNIIF